MRVEAWATGLWPHDDAPLVKLLCLRLWYGEGAAKAEADREVEVAGHVMMHPSYRHIGSLVQFSGRYAGRRTSSNASRTGEGVADAEGEMKVTNE